MFFSHSFNKEFHPKLSVREESEKKLLDEVRSHFDEKQDSMKQELLEAGILEAEHEQFLTDFKAETETKLITEFNKKVLERAKQDAKDRFNFASQIVKSGSSDSKIKAKALFDLYNFYMYGWVGVQIDKVYAMRLLLEAAELGNCRAAYELSRTYLEQKNFDATEKLIQNIIKMNGDNADTNDLAILDELKNLLSTLPTLKNMVRQSFGSRPQANLF